MRHAGGAIGWLLLLPWAVLAQEPEVLVELDRDRTYLGESVGYVVTLQNFENPSPPKLEGFNDFEVKSLGEQSLDSQQITIINGVRRELVRRGRQYNYSLTPRRTGRLTIPAPTAESAGRVVRGASLSLEVVAPEAQDLVVAEVTADRTEVYPQQPFTIRLSIAVRGLPEPLGKENPLALGENPAISLPWASDEELPSGLQPKEPWNQWLQRYANAREEGFTVNNVVSDSSFLLLGRRYAVFQPSPQRVERTTADGRTAAYWEYVFERTFQSTSVQPYRFGPVTVKGLFASGLDSSGRRLAGQRVFAVTSAVTVTVRDVPQEGRPASYTGAIGSFALSASLLPTKARVGDPLTLTLTLRGEGALDRASAPQLEQLPELAERFKIYDATEETLAGSKQFTYSLRPRTEQVSQLPAIPLAYFDPRKEQYVELRTEPIPLTVEPADELASNEIAMARRGQTPVSDIELEKAGIFQNMRETAALRNQAIRPERWFAGLGMLAGVFSLLVVVRRRVEQRRGNVAWQRRRGAPRQAQRRLQAALSNIQGGELRGAADELSGTLVGLVAAVADLPEAGLTAADAQRQLLAWELDPELVRRWGQLLEACDHARYGGSADALRGLSDDAESLLRSLVTAFRGKRLL